MKSHGFTIIEAVVTISILAIIASFAYVWYEGQNKTSTSIVSSLITPTPTALITPTVAKPQTKTYTSSIYGYSFTYPTDWQVLETPTGQDINLSIKDADGQDLMRIIQPGIGCASPGDNVTYSSFNVGSVSTGKIQNLCDSSSYAFDVNANGHSLDLIILFVGTSNEDKGRQLLRSMTGMTT
jgi:prepilin-type N-terminal cleavage/methylation domain-containing protein